MVLLKLLFIVALSYGVVGVILSFIPITPDNEYGETKKPPYIIKLPFRYLAVIFGGILLFLSSIVIKISGQDVGVVVTPNGVDGNELHTGWHLLMPWNNLYRMDKTIWVYTCANAPKEGAKPDADAIWAPTKDGIKMGFDVSVSWRIDASEAPWIYANVSENDDPHTGRYIWLEENVIRPKLKSNMALTVSDFTPIEVYSSQRQTIQDDVLKRMRAECKPYKLIIENIDIREVYYNKEYEQAINNKKLAEQEALRLVEVTKQQEELKKQEAIKKDIAILKAEGESKALQIKGQSITANPKIIELQWIDKWNGVLPNYMMGNGQGVILNLPNAK